MSLESFTIHSIAPPVMKGILLKRGSFRQNWKRRFFVLERGRLLYFEPSHWLQQGERDLTSFQITKESEIADHCIVLNAPQKSNSLVLRCKNSAECDVWISLLNAHITFANLITNNPELLLQIIQSGLSPTDPTKPAEWAGTDDESSPSEADGLESEAIPVPPAIRGWMLKQGHVVRNWKRRYFVLEAGVLKYYLVSRIKSEVELPPESSFQQVLKGQLDLVGFTVVSENVTGVAINRDTGAKGPGHLVLRPSTSALTKRTLLLAADHDAEWLMWAAALGLHIEYANESLRQRLLEEERARAGRPSTLWQSFFGRRSSAVRHPPPVKIPVEHSMMKASLSVSPSAMEAAAQSNDLSPLSFQSEEDGDNI